MERLTPHPKDQMTPKERMTAMLAGQPIDRLPCVPFLGEPSVALLGCTVRDYWHNADLMVQAELAAFQRFGQDSVGAGPDAYGLAEALGSELEFPLYGPPFVKRPLLSSYDDLDRLEPFRPQQDGRLPLFLEVCQRLQQAAGDVIGVGSSVAGPFTIAAYLRGVDEILRDVYKEGEQVHRLMQYVADACKAWIDLVAPLGVGISMADPLASPSVLNPKLFGEYVFPYFVQIVDHAWKKTGQKPSLHMCGLTYKIWPYLKQLHISGLSLDNVIDLARAREGLGDTLCLMGNVDPVKVIQAGPPERIRQAVAECVAKAGANPKGFVVASGCQIPVGTPMEHVEAMVDAVRALGGSCRQPYQ